MANDKLMTESQGATIIEKLTAIATNISNINQNIQLTSDKVTQMTGYSEPANTGAISASNTLNEAIGKLERKADNNQTNISTVQTDTSLLKNTITTIRFASGTSRTFQFTQRTNYHIFMVFGFVQGVGLVSWTCKIDNTGTLKVFDTLANTEVTQSTISYTVDDSVGTVTISSSVAQWSYLTIIKNAEIT